jgi:ABC-type transporter Mla subunit MlaD
MNVVLGVLGLLGLLVVVLWLIGLPGDDDEEETAGFVTANWDRIRDRFGR